MQMNRKILTFLGGVCGLLLWSESSFATCSIVKRGFVAQNVIMDIGSITINPSSPIGILKTGSFTINAVSNLTECDRNGGYNYGRILIGSEVTKTGALLAAVPNGPIYSTNVKGIGVRLYRNSGDIQSYYPHTYTLTRNSTHSLSAGQFVVDIIKISNEVGTGALAGGLYSTYYGDGDGPEKPKLTSTLNANGIVIQNSTCEITGNANQVIDMGTIQRSKLTSVGQSDTNEQNFQINVKCNGGNNKTQAVKVGFDYTPDPLYASNGVIANATTGSGGSVYAKGIGIQLLKDQATDKGVIKTGDVVNIGQTVLNQETTPVLKLRARYFKTAVETTPGDVSAVVNFNLVYQ